MGNDIIRKEILLINKLRFSNKCRNTSVIGWIKGIIYVVTIKGYIMYDTNGTKNKFKIGDKRFTSKKLFIVIGKLAKKAIILVIILALRNDVDDCFILVRKKQVIAEYLKLKL